MKRLLFVSLCLLLVMVGYGQIVQQPHPLAAYFSRQPLAAPSQAGLAAPVMVGPQMQGPSTVDEGLAYLYAVQNGAGSWGGSSTALNGLFATTSSVVQALRDLETAVSGSQQDGIQYLSDEATELIPFRAHRVLTLAGSGPAVEALVAADVAALLASQNADGGWGTLPGTDSNVWDTALALQALKVGGSQEQTVLRQGLTYLMYARQSDSGWGLQRGDASHIFYTALVLATLNAHDATFALTGTQEQTITYLRNQQQADGGYGQPDSTPFETALVLEAILQAGLPLTPAEQQAIAYLDGQQEGNGSWRDDPYATALALRALIVPPDSDGDGMIDSCETAHNLNPYDPSDAWLDADGDGLPNRQECELGTNPHLADTDGDMVSDRMEIACLSDPLCDE